MKKIAVVLVSLMIVACNTPPKKEAPSTPQADTNKTTPVSTAGAEHNDLTNQNHSVYFDFAKATITPEYKAIIQMHAESIKGHKNGTVTLDGNCDERGSAEYNLGLGQRRADAVKKLLVAAGVQASQIKTTSSGKEKPKLTCHEESCWKGNRRVDFVQG